jgi:hypothetical protein
MAGTQLAPFVDRYPAFAGDAAEIIETMRENLGNAKLSAFNLDRIKMPSGGGLAWEVQTLEGPEPQKTLTGIIVYHRDVRTFWRDEYSGQGNPPDCSSDDGITGYGDPGGDCSSCPLAQFDSGRNGGQACKQQKQVFLLMGEGMLPAVLNLPPTSLRPYRDFMLRLGSNRILYRHVEVTIGLEKVSGGDVPDYSRATIRLSSRLDTDEAQKVNDYSSMIADIVRATPVEAAVGRDPEPPAEAPAPAAAEDKPKGRRRKPADGAEPAAGTPDF